MGDQNFIELAAKALWPIRQGGAAICRVTATVSSAGGPSRRCRVRRFSRPISPFPNSNTCKMRKLIRHPLPGRRRSDPMTVSAIICSRIIASFVGWIQHVADSLGYGCRGPQAGIGEKCSPIIQGRKACPTTSAGAERNKRRVEERSGLEVLDDTSLQQPNGKRMGKSPGFEVFPGRRRGLSATVRHRQQEQPRHVPRIPEGDHATDRGARADAALICGRRVDLASILNPNIRTTGEVG